MACCLTAPSHYLKQLWLIITKVPWHSFNAVSQQMSLPSITEISFEIGYLKFYLDIPGANELKLSIWLVFGIQRSTIRKEIRLMTDDHIGWIFKIHWRHLNVPVYDVIIMLKLFKQVFLIYSFLNFKSWFSYSSFNFSFIYIQKIGKHGHL